MGNIEGLVNKVYNESKYKSTKMPPAEEYPKAPTV